MRRVRRRGRGERGATAVLVAVLVLVLMGFTALAVDMGGAYSDRQQLQNGADAAALAIAASCAKGACVDTADQYVKLNSFNPAASGTIVGAMSSPLTVRATQTHQNALGALLGVPTTAVSASATAAWGWPSAGQTFPLTFSWCAFWNATGGWDDGGKAVKQTLTVVHLKEANCTPPAHNEVPGGFGWVNSVNCIATVSAGQTLLSDPGMDEPSNCKTFDWSTIRNKTVLVPIFENFTGKGSNATYTIKGLAAFTITGYCFSSSAQWNLTNCPSDKRIQGHFSSYTDMSGAFAISTITSHFGVAVVKLTS